MYFSRSYTKIAALLVPTAVRSGSVSALAQVLNVYLDILHSRLVVSRNDARYKMGHSSQVCYLQASCNDALDPIQRRIEIRDTTTSSEVVPILSDDIYGQPIILSDDNELLLYDDDYYNRGLYDFEVYVPFAISLAQRYQLIAVLEFYKLAGKRYLINAI